MLNCSYFLTGTITLTTYYILHTLSLFVFGYLSFKIFNKAFEYTLVGLIFGGGVWNLIERLQFGCVQDYFNFFDLFYFNISDLAISIGILTLIARTGIKALMPK